MILNADKLISGLDPSMLNSMFICDITIHVTNLM